jgi:hypothetical protein
VSETPEETPEVDERSNFEKTKIDSGYPARLRHDFEVVAEKVEGWYTTFSADTPSE